MSQKREPKTQPHSHKTTSSVESKKQPANTAAADAATIEKTDEPQTLSAAQKEIDQIQKKLAGFEDKYKRLFAEFENYKKRNSQEQALRLKFAQQPLASSVITGLDNLEQAIDQLQKKLQTDAVSHPSAQEFLAGIELVYQSFCTALKQHSCNQISPLGEVFNPNLHEAVGTAENTAENNEQKEGSVAQVLRTGYLLHDRVIRPAMVHVYTAKKPAASDLNQQQSKPNSDNQNTDTQNKN